MASVLQTLRSYNDKLDRELSKQPFLVKLEGQTGIAKVQLVIGAVVLLIVFMSFNSLALMMSNIVGLVVPAYFALQACKENQPMLNAMFYFMLLAAVMLLENTIPGLMSLIPFYPFVKIGFLGWLCSPKHQGALFLMGHVAKNVGVTLPVGARKPASSANEPSYPLSSKLSSSMKSALSTPLND